MLSASVTVDKEVVSSIGKGVLVFAAVAPGDTEKEMNTIASKVVKMKLWDDENGSKVSHRRLTCPVCHRSWDEQLMGGRTSGKRMSWTSAARFSVVCSRPRRSAKEMRGDMADTA